MRTHTNDRLKGTLDLLVLKTLASQGRMHGYAITLRIEQISENVLRLEEGSLYPALHRMTQAGWLRFRMGGLRKQSACSLLLDHRGRAQAIGGGDAGVVPVDSKPWRVCSAWLSRRLP